MNENSPGLLPTTALSAAVFGAAGSLGFLYNAGRTSPPLVMAIMAAWVLGPFVGLVLAHVISARWSGPTRQAIHIVMLAVTLCSLAAYWSDFRHPHTPRAAVFVLVPGVSWVVSILAVGITAVASRQRNSRRTVTDPKAR